MPSELLPAAAPAWRDLGLRDLWFRPIPALAARGDRALLRLAATLAQGQVRDILGWERVLPEHDPFILVANHGSRREALYLTAALMLARGGRPVHFLADWNFRLIPGVGYLYRRSGAITVTRKDARPRLLNRLKPRYLDATGPLEQARARLQAGAPIALFPEGTVNRHPGRLLRGRYGAARLSLETGVPILPVGIRFLGEPLAGRRADSASSMEIRIGAPCPPPPCAPGPAPIAAVRLWHERVMTEIAVLCGKAWDSTHATAQATPTPSPTAQPDPRVAGGPDAQEA